MDHEVRMSLNQHEELKQNFLCKCRVSKNKPWTVIVKHERVTALDRSQICELCLASIPSCIHTTDPVTCGVGYMCAMFEQEKVNATYWAAGSAV